MPVNDFKESDVHRMIEDFTGQVLYEDWEGIHPVFRESFPVHSVLAIEDRRELHEAMRQLQLSEKLLAICSKEEKELLQFSIETRNQAKQRVDALLAQPYPRSRYCLVRFNYPCQKDILESFYRRGYRLKLQGQETGLLEVPDEPLRWNNLGMPRKNKNIRQVLVLLGALALAALFLALNFGIVALYFYIVQDKGVSGYLAIIYPIFPMGEIAFFSRYFQYCLKY